MHTGATVKGTNGILHKSVTYFGCNGVGYYCNKYPSAEQSELQMLQCSHLEENVGFNKIIGGLKGGVPKE